MQSEPQPEHAWLKKLIGAWTFEETWVMGQDQPPTVSAGTETVRMLGELWVVSEARRAAIDGVPADSFLTLGFDPARGRFVGTFVATMMSSLWIYEGSLDGDGRVLTLDTEGPSFTGDGTLTRYRDIITCADADNRTLTSEALLPDGSWFNFLTSRYRRNA
ncbi:MAG: hypothetical protein B7Z15_06105 [Rhizobiales bacterium 32-66-8]|nr:MAG: hypothetical protein B7Z15_06105 [Rhizobiales bacterium 32-66-8]